MFLCDIQATVKCIHRISTKKAFCLLSKRGDGTTFSPTQIRRRVDPSWLSELWCWLFPVFTNPGISDFLSQWPTRLNLWEVLVFNKKNNVQTLISWSFGWVGFKLFFKGSLLLIYSDTDCFCQSFCCRNYGWTSWLSTPPKTNISPENQWLEDEMSIHKWSLFGGHVKFSGMDSKSPFLLMDSSLLTLTFAMSWIRATFVAQDWRDFGQCDGDV